MKKFMIILMVLACFIGSIQAGNLTYGKSNYQKNVGQSFGLGKNDPLMNFIDEVDTIFSGTATQGVTNILFDEISGDPTSTEGRLYYNTDANVFKFYNGTAWLAFEAGSGTVSLDSAYGVGNTIDVDGSAVTLTVSDTDNNAALLVVQNDTTNDPDAMNITSAADAATAVGLQIDCTAGFDIQGTSDSWSVSIAGLFDGEGLTGVTNSQGILFDTNNEIQFGDNSEDVAFNFAVANTLTLATDTGLDSFAFGVVDDLEGVGTIVFDDAASTISLTSTGATDLTIQQATAGQDASLILQSSGTGLDALSLISSVADIKINSADNIDIDAADNIAIDTAGGTFTVTTVAGDLTLAATSGSVNITSDEADPAAILIQASAAGGDVNIDSVLGRIEIEAEEDAADALFLIVDGGTTSTLKIFNDTGTAADSIELLTDAGGITNTMSAGAFVVNAIGASAGDVTLAAGDILTLTSVDTKIFDGAAAETWIIEGTADDHEASVVFTDPTADITWTFPTGATDTLAVMASTLATNIPEAANAVTGGTNQLIFEGATADAFETIITPIDATADATITLPDDSGAIVYAPGGTADLAGAGAIDLTKSFITYESTGANALTIADGENGQIITIVHDVDAGAGTLTPSGNFSGWATMVFTNVGETATFMYVDDTVGWIVLGTSGTTTQPLNTQ